MSTAVHAEPEVVSTRRWPRIDVRPLLWAVSLAWLVVLIPSLITQWRELEPNLLSLLPWVLVLSIANLVPVRGWKADMVPDWPIQLAAVLVLTPLEAGLVGFVGAFDQREFRRNTTLSKAVFNRSHVAVVNFIVSLIVHSLLTSPTSSPLIIPLSFLALLTRIAMNYLLAGVVISFDEGRSLQEVIMKLRIGRLSDFILTLIGWAVEGAMLAVVYDQLHPAVLFAILVPTLVGRQVLATSQMFLEADRAYRSSEATVRHISRQILQERLDERRLIAAELHDDVLPPLFKMTLMAHVLEADLARGRLLELEGDLRDLVTTAEKSAENVRSVIGELRHSGFRRGGLPSALSTFVTGLTSEITATFHTEFFPIETDESSELTLYQIAKEALMNAALHSRAKNIWVHLGQDSDFIRLTVRDDGLGFNPGLDRRGHFGIEIMRERARLAGGQIFIDSDTGSGTTVTALIPRGPEG
ncbi:MAG: histidine kinase [Actinomycetota bacterium]|nr:histidine kinase [Actinomycetota bacterium]